MATADTPRPPILVTVEHVAELLDSPKTTIYSWIHSGKLPACKIGKRYRVRMVDLESFVNGTLVSGDEQEIHASK